MIKLVLDVRGIHFGWHGDVAAGTFCLTARTTQIVEVLCSTNQLPSSKQRWEGSVTCEASVRV